MELPRGTVLLLLAVLALAATVQSSCLCANNKRTQNCVSVDNTCKCTSFGSNVTVDCGTLSSKCLLMKAEVYGTRIGRSNKPKSAFLDNDGIYDPECDDKGNFKAKQCNGTDTCWCVNTAGVRRTEKGDKNMTCDEVVRTSWIMIEMKHLERDTDLDKDSVERTFIDELSQRYKLNRTHISVTYEKPSIVIDLKQNATQKSVSDVDIADVAYYFEKDVKGDSVIVGPKLYLHVSGQPLQLDGVLIYYIDEKAPTFSMKRLTAGVIAVIVVVVLAIVAGILVLVFTRRKRGKYEKAEVKEMNEMHRELNS
ncbi:epithelial cell adhesion molecule [Rhineura floridana]|uniref:epithelial cell adhesion molecule n=1 Tax=Rhineura floridana TaxID=261503 RepID=UPI002AC83DB9|nr:epithelial cell adhesion molecule [Rhineura floridana]XP_061481623.1 epithelial cell adhesion molecule [Rhineura floridana]